MFALFASLALPGFAQGDKCCKKCKKKCAQSSQVCSPQACDKQTSCAKG